MFLDVHLIEVFKISGKNDFEVTIKEAFHIKFSKPIMNKQLFTQGSSFVLNVF